MTNKLKNRDLTTDNFNVKIITFLIFIMSMPVFAQSFEECNETLKSLMQNEINHDQLKNLLKIQGKLTLHRLAWASTIGEDDKKSFTLEKKINEILETMSENKNPDFLEAKELYKKNQLSRTALARIMPFISNILNDQNKIKDQTKRNKYIIQLSDIKLLSILAEKEGIRSDGLLDDRFFKDTSHNNSILNFTKVINSSLRNRTAGSSIGSFEEQIEKLNKELKTQISNLPLSRPCQDLLFNECMSNNQTTLLDNTLASLFDDLKAFNKQENLRYDDFWLHVGKKKYVDPAIIREREKPVILPAPLRPPPPIPEILSEELPISEDKKVSIELLKDQDEYFEILSQKILDKYPYFLTKQDLLNDKELVLSLATAIESESSSFNYKGTLYHLPESYNKTDIKKRGEELYKSAFAGHITPMDRRLNLPHVKMIDSLRRQLSEYKNRIPFFSDKLEGHPNKDKILEKLNNEFLYSLIGADNANPKQKVIEFKGALYDVRTGQKLPKTLNALLSYPKSKSSSISSIEAYAALPRERRIKAIEAAISGDKSYDLENKIYHLSHTPVGKDLQIAKKTKLKPDEIKSRINAISEDQELVTKLASAIIEGDNNIIFEGNVIDTLTLRAIPKQNQVKSIEQFQVTNKIPISITNTTANEIISPWYAAISNNEEVFSVDGNNYNSLTGEILESGISRTPSGMFDYNDYKGLEEQLNRLDDKELIIEFHKNFKTKEECDYYTIVDKMNQRLIVYNKNGEELFNKEILVGAIKGDKRTIFLDDSYAQGRRATNAKTAAGIFYSYEFRDQDDDKYYQYYNNNLMALVTEKGAFNGPLNKDQLYETVMAMHQTPIGLEHRNSMFNNGDPDDNRTTNGCLNLTQEDFENYKQKFPSQGCPVYVLPEEINADGSKVSRMKVLNGKLIFTPTSRLRCSGEEVCHKDYYYSPIETNDVRKIDMVVMNPERAGNQKVLEFIQTLEDSKLELSTKLGLSNNEYNDLAQMAYAVMGVESGFGTESRYKIKEGELFQEKGRSLASMGITQVSSPLRFFSFVMQKYGKNIGQFAVNSAKIVNRNNTSNSRGLTQIKNVTSFTKDLYPDINENNLDEPKNAAIATVIVLAQMSKQLDHIKGNHNNINSQNRAQFLYYLYNGASSQIRNGAGTPSLNVRAREIQSYLDEIHIFEKLD